VSDRDTLKHFDDARKVSVLVEWKKSWTLRLGQKRCFSLCFEKKNIFYIICSYSASILQ